MTVRQNAPSEMQRVCTRRTYSTNNRVAGNLFNANVCINYYERL